MRTFLVNYSDDRYRAARFRLNRSATRHGVEGVVSWSAQDVHQSAFYEQHRLTLDSPRGAGYWLWKPFIILDLLSKVNDGDIVIYCDSGMELIRPPDDVLASCAENDGFFCCKQPGHQNFMWTKRDCFFYMGCDDEDDHADWQSDASFMAFQKNAATTEFVAEYRSHCCDARILTDQPNECGLPNLEGFRDHRHDQSVLSLLLRRWGIPRFRPVSQYGFGTGHTPPQYYSPRERRGSLPTQLVEHHREQGQTQADEDPAWKAFVG
jgi:hypothetical protein